MTFTTIKIGGTEFQKNEQNPERMTSSVEQEQHRGK